MTNENQDNGGGVAFDLDDIRSLAVTLMTEGRGPEYKVAESAWHEITHLRSTHADLLASLKFMSSQLEHMEKVVIDDPPVDELVSKLTAIICLTTCGDQIQTIAAAEAGGAS